MSHKKIVIIAGPNGAGKTTFAREFLPGEAHCPVFVNADLIAGWRALGYVVKLIFLRLDTPEEAIARVEARVMQGGHHIPEAIVRRRFIKGYENFLNVYQADVNFWQLFDNSGLEPQLIDEGVNP